MSSAAIVAIPIMVLVAWVVVELFTLRQLTNARRLVWLTHEQWYTVILVSGPFGAATFLYLERDR